MKIYVIMEDDEFPRCQCSNQKYPRTAFSDEKKAKEYCKQQNKKNSYKNLFSYETIELDEIDVCLPKKRKKN